MASLSIQSVEKLMSVTSASALVPAGVAGFYTHHALKDALTEAGFTSMASPMAMAGAVGITVCYGAFVHLLLKGLAPLLADERRRATPTIAAGTAILLLGSALPNIIVTGGGIASGIEDRSYIANIAATGDQLKKAAQAAEQLDIVITGEAGKLDATARFESTGGLSGAAAQGVLADAIRKDAERLRAVQAEIAGTRERIADEISRIDAATDKMRSALADRTMTLADRRTRMQRHGDEARSAVIAVAALTPVAPLQALADQLMGPQIEPRWSARPEIRKSQEEGFRKLKSELKRLGKLLAHQASDLALSVKVPVPIYDPETPSVLVVKHAAALTSIFAFAIALDTLPLVLFGVACVLYDAARRRNEPVLSPPIAPPVAVADDTASISQPTESIRLEAASADDRDEVPVGPHPHRLASRARMLEEGGGRTANGNSKRKLRNDFNGSDEEGSR